MKSFNINQVVHVNLTEKGFQHYFEKMNSYNHVGICFTKEELEAKSKNGYYPFQMHDFMNLFGGDFYVTDYFNTNILIDDQDLNDVY